MPGSAVVREDTHTAVGENNSNMESRVRQTEGRAGTQPKDATGRLFPPSCMNILSAMIARRANQRCSVVKKNKGGVSINAPLQNFPHAFIPVFRSCLNVSLVPRLSLSVSATF